MGKIDNFTRDYIESMLWSIDEILSDSSQIDENYTAENISKEAMEQIKADCEAFQEQAEHLLTEDDPHPGHDFWLTRNGHGAGFWDGDYLPKERGEKLAEIARSFGEQWAYISDKNQIELV